MLKKVARILVGACFGGIIGWCINPKIIAIPIVIAVVGLVAFVVYQAAE